jgi:hypothetical protein
MVAAPNLRIQSIQRADSGPVASLGSHEHRIAPYGNCPASFYGQLGRGFASDHEVDTQMVPIDGNLGTFPP